MKLTYILMTDNYLLATPDCFASSERTQNINFFDLANDYELQVKMSLSSSVFIKPLSFLSTPLTGNELIHAVASYLSAFKTRDDDRNNVFEYLINNGELKILWLK